MKSNTIDYTKVLGFDGVSDRISGSIDLQDETIGPKLGAKVGDGEPAGARVTPAKIDYAKLLGFDGVGDQLSGGVDFQDETINAKLGAKVGVEVMN
jgi:hypothetical protein